MVKSLAIFEWKNGINTIDHSLIYIFEKNKNKNKAKREPLTNQNSKQMQVNVV